MDLETGLFLCKISVGLMISACILHLNSVCYTYVGRFQPLAVGLVFVCALIIWLFFAMQLLLTYCFRMTKLLINNAKYTIKTSI